MPKAVSISVREFALPVPRRGSIEAHSGFGRAAEEGQEIHLRVQQRRKKEHPAYEAEVRVSREFERDGYTFAVSGRMDGLFPGPSPRIEEIKSAFSVRQLSGKLTDEHPYCLQLRTYGYFHFLETGLIPELTLHLVSTRTRESEDLPLKLDVPAYERWLEARLAELVADARLAEKRAARRRAIAEDFAFPFDQPRPGQLELVQAIENGGEGLRMLIQAPTGLGKTAGVMYPMLRDALSRGQRLVYVTPKNSQHAVAEDAAERFRERGSKLKSLTITAKSKICLKAEPLCNPEYCEYARDHYTKVHERGVLDELRRKRKLSFRAFRRLAEEHEVCPFELQHEAAKEADVVICDYNYVFAPHTAFGKIAEGGALGQDGKPNLVIDEAHNLPARAMDYYSPALSSVALERMREGVLELPARFRAEAEQLLDDCIQVLIACRPADGKPSRIEPDPEPFLEQDAKLRSFLSRYLESDVEIAPRDVVLRLVFYWSEFAAALEFTARPEFFASYQPLGQPHPTGGTVRIVCCDASEWLRACYDDYERVVGFSATLKPFDYYQKLSGMDPDLTRTEEFASPFPRGHRKLLLIPQISTRYSERERNYPRVAEVIRRVAEVRPGNYFAFFPSFEFLERVLARFTAPPGFEILKQEREMKGPAIEAVLGALREPGSRHLVFAVQGGVFSEGVDYPGEMAIGAFVVGPPLPSFDLEREEMRAYYDKNFRAGFDYAYAYPAMAKAVQAAGRVIRSETDRGLIVLLDNRFLQPSYAQSMPVDWFEISPRELVPSSILREVREFWGVVE